VLQPAYFSFCKKSGGLHRGRRKPSIEHFAQRKRPGRYWSGNCKDFKKRKISLDFFVSFLGDAKKKREGIVWVSGLPGT
jgi:hypothetical protein